MSFEQQEYTRNEEEKKKKTLEWEKREKFLLEKNIMRESSDLIQKLAREIATEFGIDIAKASELIESSTSHSLEWLKANLGQNNTLNTNRLLEAIKKAQGSVEDLSKKHRESLKEILDRNNYTPEKHEYYTTETLFPPRILARAKNPQNIWDQFMWLWLGIIDSSEAVILFTYWLWKGILFTPYHLYLLFTGQAEYEGFSKI